MSSKEENGQKSSHAEEEPTGLPAQRKSSRPSRRRKVSKKRMSANGKSSNRTYLLTSARAYAFNFCLFSALGSLLPFMPVFYGLLGFSSLENGLLYAVRPLVSFWCGPLVASFATKTRYRSLILFLCVAGAVASTFCISVVHSSDGGILKSSSCQSDKNSAMAFPASVVEKFKADANLNAPKWNLSSKIGPEYSLNNKTRFNSWKTFINHSSKIFYRKLKKGIVLKNLFLYVLALTIVSELFLSPTLHMAQASIKYNKHQSFFSNICLNRVFCKVGMLVSAITISFVAWKYKCIFYHVHYFYFHFYGFLVTGCITALAALLLPRETPSKNSFFRAMSMGCWYALSSWSSAGYIFGLWVAGIAEGAISAYLLWFAASNGANEIVIGMLVTISMMTDLTLHWSVGISTKWIGHSGLLCFGVFLMSLQFFILSNVNNPLYLLPAQLLCGLASSCIKSSLVSCAQSKGNIEMERILCFVYQSAYLGLGLGLGGIFVSMPYYVFGPQRTFTALSILTLSYTVVHILVQCIAWKLRAKSPRNGRYKMIATCDSNNGDWLVDALEEEELRDLKEDFIIVDEDIESQAELDCPNNNEEINDQEKHM